MGKTPSRSSARVRAARSILLRPTSGESAFPTSMAQIIGAHAPSSAVRCKRSFSASSGMNHAIATEPSRMNAPNSFSTCIAVFLPFVPVERPEVHLLSEVTDVLRGLERAFADSLRCLAGALLSRQFAGRHKLRHRLSTTRDHGFFAAVRAVDEFGQPVLCIEKPDFIHGSNPAS